MSRKVDSTIKFTDGTTMLVRHSTFAELVAKIPGYTLIGLPLVEE